jgi:hypothetical protein
MNKVKFPSIRAVAQALRNVSAFVDTECDVRLQVWDDSQWKLRYGDSSYDQDHRGFWVSSKMAYFWKRLRSTYSMMKLIA